MPTYMLVSSQGKLLLFNVQEGEAAAAKAVAAKVKHYPSLCCSIGFGGFGDFDGLIDSQN